MYNARTPLALESNVKREFIQIGREDNSRLEKVNIVVVRETSSWLFVPKNSDSQEQAAQLELL